MSIVISLSLSKSDHIKQPPLLWQFKLQVKNLQVKN
jgi:hypothetical protein